MIIAIRAVAQYKDQLTAKVHMAHSGNAYQAFSAYPILDHRQ